MVSENQILVHPTTEKNVVKTNKSQWKNKNDCPVLEQVV